MILDSDDEAPAASTSTNFVDKPEFDDEAAANSTALPEITQTLDLSLGAAVLAIAVLPVSHCSAEDAAWNGADILKVRIVFAATCATGDIHLITLPLTPPSHESKARPEIRQNLLAGNAGKGAWGETVALLGGQGRPCEGVAITIAKPKPESRSGSSDRAPAPGGPRAIVAAHSREASGTLRLWDVPLNVKPGSTTRVEPFQTEYLPHPLINVSFNPLQITQLLAVDPSHAARIYDFSIPSVPLEDAPEGQLPPQGSWLLSLYPPFARGSVMSTTRKPIVAAKWIAHGRAVLALLADGQWGIWDIDGASPSTNGSGGGLFGKTGTGLRGSAITSFSVTGHLEGTSPLRNPASQKSPAVPGSGGDFVPMTPHTRRDAIAASLIGGSERLAAVRGGIDIIKQAPFRQAEPGEESAILWLGGADPVVSVIPTVSRFWESQLRRAGGGVNLWSGAQPTRMTRLTDLSTGLLGERCTGAIGIPKSSRPSPGANRSDTPSDNPDNSSDGLPIEVIVQGESRIVFVEESEEAATSLTSRLLGARKKPRAELKTTKAILAFPRPEKPNSVAFNLSVSQRGKGGLLRPRLPVKGLFDPVDEAMDILPSTEAADEDFMPTRPGDTGLLFAKNLTFAADVPDDESEAEARDVDQEIMDIMEIDRELEQMESDRQFGAKRVFFEEG